MDAIYRNSCTLFALIAFMILLSIFFLTNIQRVQCYKEKNINT
jgi:hypothetical protein